MPSIKKSDITVVRCYMQDDMRKYAVKVLQKAMNRFTEEREVASYIKFRFDSRHHANWHCIVGKHFDCSVAFESSRCILLRVEDTLVLLFKYG
ncbi:unnamed protein product [Heterobilharzia americana]|nr:unnamed protein product [Heterobilharzia americana]CAH8443844.1 unnamed protein product [Heterobilharzia americana]